MRSDWKTGPAADAAGSIKLLSKFFPVDPQTLKDFSFQGYDTDQEPLNAVLSTVYIGRLLTPVGPCGFDGMFTQFFYPESR